jgi:ribosomal protein S18 acetylase RimI-like enzyme
MEENKFHIEQVTTFSHELAEEIRRLTKLVGHNYKDLSDEDVQAMLKSSCNNLIVAREISTNQIVGMITLLVYRIPYVKKAVVEDLSVDESFRRHGIGSALFKKAIELAKEKGVAYVDFNSRPEREAGNNLYEKLGLAQRETNVYRLNFTYDTV